MPVVIDASATGRRVVVRFRRDPSVPGPPLTDVVGRLLSLDAQHLVVETRSGRAVVALADVTLARVVEPSSREILWLQELAHRGWRASEIVEGPVWVWRHHQGWTRRGNSVLTRHHTADDAQLGGLLDETVRFYRERGLPARIQVPLPARQSLDDELAARGWEVETEAFVYTKPLLAAPDDAPALPGGLSVEITAQVTQDWAVAYAPDGLPEVGRDLLERHPRAGFLLLRDASGTPAGRARGTIDEGWLAITSVEVAAATRGRGLGALVMSAIEEWGRTNGARDAHLQVEASNGAAMRFYRRHGWSEHHRYHYRVLA